MGRSRMSGGLARERFGETNRFLSHLLPRDCPILSIFLLVCNLCDKTYTGVIRKSVYF